MRSTYLKIFPLLLAIFVQPANAADNPLAKDASYTLPGLKKDAEIIVDRWGVPHIYAQDHYDTFFVQGFNAARDRLWQIDLWRRRGLGQLSAVLGPDYAAQDEAARLFLYRGDMYAEWLAYGNDAKRIAEAFAAGVNAFVELALKRPELMPPEFALLGYQPALWNAADIVRIRSNGLWRNVNDEVWRAQMACAGQLELAGRWRQLQPSWETKVPAGLDPCVIPANVLDKYRLAKAPVSFANNPRLSAVADDPHLGLSVGSNNWVVNPDRTTTGRPILADDPHRGHATPSLRYIAHLHGPGIDVIGAGEPALPGISIGHNETIAFGLTIFPIDQEDLYVYAKRNAGYVYQGREQSFTTVTETLGVKGEAKSRTLNLKFTQHGPVVAETNTHVFAVRAAWLLPGMSPYFGSIEYMRAQNWREFVGALNRWGAPSENQVYADIDGNIGYKPAGRFPKRDNWDGLLPVPGDGRYEWDGFFDMDVLPEEYNPERGFSGTANSMNLPVGYPIDRYKIGFEWSAPWRYARLWQTLSEDTEHSMQDSLDLQRNYHSVLVQRLLASLPELAEQPDGGQLLSAWDGELAAASSPAALYSVWYTRHLVPALSRSLAPPPVRLPPLDSLTVLEMLATSRGREIAYTTLPGAYAETERLLGDDPAAWQWGQLHQIRFKHPLLDLAPAALQAQMRMPPYPRGGDANTTNNTGFRLPGFDVAGGASFRMVVDVGNWDAALATNAPGQSGDPRSPFYDNLLENWATEDHFPLLYSKAAVTANAAFRIQLRATDQR